MRRDETMKVSGFTFIKNAVKYGYPVVESIRSVLPMVDEMVVCAGDSEDSTNELIGNITDDKIKIILSVWDKDLREGGKVLAVETNKALDATAADADWLFYIQADEAVHEKYHGVIIDAMKKYKDDQQVEGLLFHYHHFYGSYRFIGDGRKWYSKEIRVIKNNKNIRSFGDAQGFRWSDGRKLQVKLIDAYIYHYGWVRNPVTMFQKYKDFGQHWSGKKEHEQWAGKLEKTNTQFDYSNIDSVTLFEGTHPAVMQQLVDKEDWKFAPDMKKKNFKNTKHRLLYFLSKNFGWRPFEYSNYKRI
ncbi:MAG: glycosyltransferase family 2 protein [Ferruginibacter sp.]